MKRAKWFAYSFYFAVAIIAFWYWHVDEHYQIFEFASYKLGFTPSENLAWEFHSKIRSGIMPIAAFGVAKIFISIKLFNPFIVEAIFRLLSAALFLFSYFRLLNFFDIKDDSRFYLICIFFWILPIIMVRYSSESIAGSLFWLGFTQGVIILCENSNGNSDWHLLCLDILFSAKKNLRFLFHFSWISFC
jgi:phosphatidylinositol glycan class B